MKPAVGGCHCAPETGQQRAEQVHHRLRVALLGTPNVG
jgi:hypothetical protein